MFFHNYNPLNHVVLSTAVAALPSIILVYLLVLHPHKNKDGHRQLGIMAPYAALIAALTSFIIAVFIMRMPALQAGSAFFYGAATGLFPIGWSFFAVFLFYYTTQTAGKLNLLQDSLTRLAPDRRLQVLLIAFSFGALIGVNFYGFGLAAAVAGALLAALGFRPVQAAVLCLIANMVLVVWSRIDSVIVISSSGNVLAQHPFPVFTLIVPFFLTAVFVFMEKGTFRDFFSVWPAALVSGLSLALNQFVLAQAGNSAVGSTLPRIISGLLSFTITALFFYFWKPKSNTRYESNPGEIPSHTASEMAKAWMPWGVLALILCLWSLPGVRTFLNGILSVSSAVPFLNGLVVHVPPVGNGVSAMNAIFNFNIFSSDGTGVILAAVLSGAFILRLNGRQWADTLRQTWARLKSLLIFLVLLLGSSYLTRYAGIDAIRGLAYTWSGEFYPLLASLLGGIGSLIYGCVAASATCFKDAKEGISAAGLIFRSAFFYVMILAILQSFL